MFKQIAKRETQSNSKGYYDSTKGSLKETNIQMNIEFSFILFKL